MVADEKVARRIADARMVKQRERELASESRVTLETFLSQRASDQEALILNLVVKADVQGSLEAITEALNKLSTDKVRISVVHGARAPYPNRISCWRRLPRPLSSTSMCGLRPGSKDVAEHENVDIRFYDIIYKLDDIRAP